MIDWLLKQRSGTVLYRVLIENQVVEIIGMYWLGPEFALSQVQWDVALLGQACYLAFRWTSPVFGSKK